MTRSVELLQQTLGLNLQRFKNFLGFSRGYFCRHNPIKVMMKGINDIIKDLLTINKKMKMARYRLNYHRHQLHKMESLIAENNEHTFLKGRKINEVR